MNVNRRTQAERSATTREALLRAGRELFGERGYAEVSTEQIVRRAGVTRGALYHLFEDKRALFAAVLDSVEADVLARIAERVVAAGADPEQLLRRAFSAWLDACQQPDVLQILLIDAPGVLGWEDWRAAMDRYGIATTTELLQAAIDTGTIAPQPVLALAHVVIGALDEAALYIARSGDRAAARAEMDGVLDRFLAGLQVP